MRNEKYGLDVGLLTTSVYGQPEAVERCTRLIQQASQTSKREPRGSILAMGPTGVGKTFIAELIAQILFLGRMLKLDMARFCTEELIAKAFAPKGELGRKKALFKQGCVVVLDEIDKAVNAKATRIFMNALDNGRLQMTDGTELDFSNVFLVCTSNLASRILLDDSKGSYDSLASFVAKAHKEWMGPEVFSRFRAAVVYRPLDYEARALVVKRELEEEGKNQAQLNTVLEIPDEESVLWFLAERGFEPELGARPLRNAVRDSVRQATYDCRRRLGLSDEARLEGRLVLSEEKNKDPYLKLEL
jgi:ATP-dependent Clp protease ATP-binding subunit ClpA